MYEKRHQKILGAAINVFNVKGYKSATTAEIASAAKIAEPTIYKHYTNKKELFLECFYSITDDLLKSYKKVYDENRNSELVYLKAVTSINVDFVVKNPDKSNFLLHLISYRDDPDIDVAYKKFILACAEGIRRVLESAQKKGVIRSKINANTLAIFFVTQYFSVVATNEFVTSKYFTKKTVYTLMRQILTID